MPTSWGIGGGTLYAFLLVLSRIGGALALIPLPGMSSGTEIPRIIAAVSITVALIPSWPRLDAFPQNIGTLILAIVTEAAFGLTIGIAVACLTEMLKMGAQIISTQSGFGFASTIDPTTTADTGILVIVAQLFGSLLFIALGLDREVIRILAASLASNPPGRMQVDPQLTEALWHFASGIFTTGVRLAFPAIALLGLIELSLGLLARINSHLQLIHVSFPLKMLAAFAVIAVIASSYPRIIEEQAAVMLQISRRAAGLEANGR